MFDELIQVLEDGKWHKLRDLKTIFNPRKVEIAVSFLTLYGMVEQNFDEVRMSRAMLDFMRKIQEIEQRETNPSFPSGFPKF